MTQNISSAVMSSRREARDSLDLFCTPLWATRALCEHVIDIRGCTVWDPAAGLGHMSRALQEYALATIVSDVHDYGLGHPIHDFVGPQRAIFDVAAVAWTCVNPPFNRALEFIERGLEIGDRGVAVFVRSVFTEGGKRYRNLFSNRPPSIVAQFVERVPLVKGRVDAKATTATSYCWMIWYRVPAWPVTKMVWIPPCRKRLEHDGDYA